MYLVYLGHHCQVEHGSNFTLAEIFIQYVCLNDHLYKLMQPQDFLFPWVYRFCIAVIDVLEHLLIRLDYLLTGPVPVALQSPPYIDKPIEILLYVLLKKGLNGFLLA